MKTENSLLAIATGGWGVTASFKLQQTGLAHYPIPMANCDDAISRSGIMQVARRHALNQGERNEHKSSGLLSTISYYGDGVWDCKASLALGWNFIGIGEESQADRLKANGAAQVFKDFRELSL